MHIVQIRVQSKSRQLVALLVDTYICIFYVLYLHYVHEAGPCMEEGLLQWFEFMVQLPWSDFLTNRF